MLCDLSGDFFVKASSSSSFLKVVVSSKISSAGPKVLWVLSSSQAIPNNSQRSSSTTTFIESIFTHFPLVDISNPLEQSTRFMLCDSSGDSFGKTSSSTTSLGGVGLAKMAWIKSAITIQAIYFIMRAWNSLLKLLKQSLARGKTKENRFQNWNCVKIPQDLQLKDTGFVPRKGTFYLP